mgnify:CR=1 FL=1
MTDEIRNDNFTNESECETRADNAQNEVVIEIRHLGKSFGDHEVLKDIDFTVRRGDVTCIIGASGSGKSTLLRCINLFETPSSGEILLNGENVVNTKNPAEFRKKVGMVFQSFNLFKNMNVLKNCTVGPRKVLKLSKEESEARARKYLRLVGMEAYVDARPGQLSGGQKQRIAIAGMLAIEPQVLVLDEATAMLDPLGRKDILRIVKDLNRKKGITVIMITQYMEEAVIADRVIVMNEGLVAFEGTPAEVFRRGTELRKINLDVPPMVELRDDLAASGIIKPCNAMTVEEMANELCPLLLKI